MSKFWGMELSLDLYNCSSEKIRSAKYIRTFAIEICKVIDAKRYGEPIVVRFGEDPRVCGYSLVQLIETSLVSGHFAEETNTAYINVFSCKEFDHHVVEDFCKHYFEAESVQPLVNYRI